MIGDREPRRWSLPPDASVSDDGRQLRLFDPNTIEPRIVPTPTTDEELSLWARPGTALAFPLHPAGAVELFARSAHLMHRMGAADELGTERFGEAVGCCWRLALRVLVPGMSVRQALDAAVHSGAFQPPQHTTGDWQTARAWYLACWAVVQATLTWEREARS